MKFKLIFRYIMLTMLLIACLLSFVFTGCSDTSPVSAPSADNNPAYYPYAGQQLTKEELKTVYGIHKQGDMESAAPAGYPLTAYFMVYEGSEVNYYTFSFKSYSFSELYHGFKDVKGVSGPGVYHYAPDVIFCDIIGACK